MLHTKFGGNRPAGSGEEELKGFYHVWAWRPSWSCDPNAVNKVLFPLTHRGSTQTLALIDQAVSEKKMF